MNYFTILQGSAQMMSLAVVVIISYGTFVLFSDCFNPFCKPKIHTFRARWRYGRRMSLAVLTGGLVGALLLEVGRVPLLQSVLVGGVITAVLALCVSVGRIRQVLHS